MCEIQEAFPFSLLSLAAPGSTYFYAINGIVLVVLLSRKLFFYMYVYIFALESVLSIQAPVKRCERKMLQFITFTEEGDMCPLVPPTSMMV